MSSYEEGSTAQFRYAVLLYKFMWETHVQVDPSELVEFGYPIDVTTDKINIYNGNIRTEAAAIGLSRSAANDGMQLLSSMSATTRLKQGSRLTKSLYILHFEPSLGDYKKFRERQGHLTHRIAPSKFDQVLNEVVELRQKVRVLEARMGSLDALLQSVREGYNNSDRHDV